MGAYLSKPVTDTISNDETTETYCYGASSMQGWRNSQEDAHNCILNYDEKTSFFAVYDGHGGAEVAKYCSTNLPEFLKTVDAYKSNNFNQALEDAFLDFDHTLTTLEVKKQLKILSENGSVSSSDENEDELEVKKLCAEATMPIKELMVKYKNAIEEGITSSPFLCAKNEDKTNDSNGIESSKNVCENGKTSKKEAKEDTTDGPEASAGSSSSNQDAAASSSTSNSSPSKTLMKNSSKRELRPKESILLLDSSGDESEDSDEEYDETQENGKESSDDDDEKENSTKADDDDEWEDIDDEDDDDDDEQGTQAVSNDFSLDYEVPGMDSGCTAVVALMKDTTLYVANAGDSRCIVSRNGIAIEMSCDHKPEDEIETKRIVAAGGEVTPEGRVNGGLNLSRAIGDHRYKQKTTLPAKEQMISAQPDIQTLSIDPQNDDFMVLACDGIWNMMSSQEVVDFVKERINTDKKLSRICEELFIHCLAPDTSGDGTGCDNMTAIIVTFKPRATPNNDVQSSSKRSADVLDEDKETHSSMKKKKTE